MFILADTFSNLQVFLWECGISTALQLPGPC